MMFYRLLQTISVLEPEVEGNRPYAIIAGHVLAGGDEFWITNRVNEERIQGRVTTLKNPCL